MEGTPMKCIKDIKTGDIKRVEDTIASKKVDAGTHIYIAKSFWKKSKTKEQRIAEAPVAVDPIVKKNKGLKSKKGKAKKDAIAEIAAETPAV